MSRQLHTTCPSGLKVHLRGLKGSEINNFANKTEAESRAIGYELLSAVVLEVEDPGPAYPHAKAGEPLEWSEVIEADRFWLYVYTRVCTFGPKYFFHAECGKATCKRRFEWGIDIPRDLRAQMLSPESIECFLKDNKFGPVDLNGAEVYFQLLTGKIEDKGVRMQGLAPDEASTVGIANRILSVNGDTGKGVIHRWVKELDWMDLMDLIDVMDESDGGIETDIDIRCTHCKSVQTVTLPLGVDFWTPDKRLRSLAKKDVEIPAGGGPIRPTSGS